MIRNLFSQTTHGALDLNIARLEHRLRLLEQQQQLSSPYPDHKAKLTERQLQVQHQLQQLLQHRSTTG